MSDDVHITRTRDWTQSTSRPITMDEWLAYIQSDPEMHPDRGFDPQTTSSRSPDGDRRLPAVWTPNARQHSEDDGVWFDYAQGRIDVCNPDNEVLSKMRLIAAALRARVIGDYGEEY